MTSLALAEITRLSVAERIQLVEDIWDTIAANPENLTLTESQQGELERRLSTFQHTHQSGSPWNEVQKRILDK